MKHFMHILFIFFFTGSVAGQDSLTNDTVSKPIIESTQKLQEKPYYEDVLPSHLKKTKKGYKIIGTVDGIFEQNLKHVSIRVDKKKYKTNRNGNFKIKIKNTSSIAKFTLEGYDTICYSLLSIPPKIEMTLAIPNMTLVMINDLVYSWEEYKTNKSIRVDNQGILGYKFIDNQDGKSVGGCRYCPYVLLIEYDKRLINKNDK